MLATIILLAGALIFTLPAPSAGGEIINNGTLSAGTAPGEIGVLNIGDTLVTGNAITLQVDTDKSGSADLISVSGEFKSDTNNTLIVIDLGSLNNVDSVPILTAAGGISGFDPNAVFLVNGVSDGLISSIDRFSNSPDMEVEFSSDGTSLLLTTNFNVQNKKMIWTGADDNPQVRTTWSMTTDNWYNNEEQDATPIENFLVGDWAVFGDTTPVTPSGPTTSGTITGSVRASQMDVTGGTWAFTGDLVVNEETWVGSALPSGVQGKLNIKNATVTLSGNNHFENGIELEAGTLNIGSNNALGTEKLTVSGSIQHSAIKFMGAYTLGNDIEMVNAAGTGSFFIDSGGYDVTIVGDIIDTGSNNGALTKEGTGTLTLTGTNDYEGKTTVRGGTLRAGGAHALDEGVYAIDGGTLDLSGHDLTMLGLEGNGGEILLGTADLTVELNNAEDITTSTVISGEGSFTKTGDSTLILTGDNTYIGDTKVEEGTLQIGRGIRGSIAGDIVNDANLIFNRSNALVYGGHISGTGSLTKDGAGTLTLTNTSNNYSGGTTVSNGLINFKDAGNFGTGNITLNGGGLQWAAGTITDISGKLNPLGTDGGIFDTNGNTVTFAVALTGAGGLTKTGAGKLTLSGTNNSYAGDTTVNAGTLAGNIAANTNLTVASGATYDGTGAARSVNALNGGGSVVNPNGLTVQSGSFSGDISGTGTLTKDGSGALTVTGSVYQGGVNVAGGALNLGSGGSLTATGDLSVASGATLGVYADASPTVNANTVTAASGAILNVTGYSGTDPKTLIKTTGGIIGDFTLHVGGATVPAPGLDSFMTVALQKINSDNDLSIQQSLVWNQAANAHGTFNIASGEFTLSDSLADNTTPNAGDAYGWDGKTLTKTGAGTLTLSGTNSYAGLTEVRAGTLALSGTGTLGNGGSGGLSLSGAGVDFDFSALNANSLHIPVLRVSGLDTTITTGDKNADFKNSILHFDIPNTAIANDTLLTVDGDADMTGTTVNLTTSSGRPALNEGGKVILLDVSGTLTNDYTATVQTAGGDVYTVRVDGNRLEAILELISPTGPAYERLKAYAESRAAGLAFVNQGLDFILNRGLGSAIAATEGPGLRVSAFGGTGGGWSRYRSGSHVDVSGMSFLAGLAVGNDTACGRVTAAAFFEGGWGNYDSHNSFSNAASVDGKGGTSYTGGGVLGRYDVTRVVFAGLYLDASARMGQTKTDFRTDDIQYNDWKANFDSSSPYYGLHDGIGYNRIITDKASLDLSAKVLWTRQEGDSVTVYRDDVRFEDADSLRTRLGGRFAYAVNDRVTPYAGAYWEHEFAGRLRSTVNGERISPPSLRGDSGMGEIGFAYHHPGDSGLTVDAGVQGYVGKRDGVSGSLRVGWAF